MRPKMRATLLVMLSIMIGMSCARPARAASEEQSLDEVRNTVINLLKALVDQGLITREKAEQLVKQAQDKATADAAASAQQDQGAVRVPYVPDIVKDEISKQVEKQVEPVVTQDVLKEAKTEGWGVPGALPEWLHRVRVTGDLTIRGQADMYGNENDLGCPPGTLYQNCTILDYQAVNTAGGVGKLSASSPGSQFLNINQDRDRMRARARIGVEASLSDSVTAGIRLASGALQDPSSESQTLGNDFGRYTVGFDEIFVRWDPRTRSGFPYLTANVGRFLNPFFSPTELSFARDLAFDGAALTGRVGLGFGGQGAEQSHVFATAGGFPVQELPLVGKNNKWLVGGQIGTRLFWGRGQRFTLAGAFYDFIDIEGRPNTTLNSTLNNYTAPLFVRFGNSMFDISDSSDPTVNLFALTSRFRIIDLATSYSLPISRYVFTVDGEVARNIGYNHAEILARTGIDLPSRRSGAVVSTSFGDPATLAFGQWRVGFGYRYVQGDAAVDSLTDADFHEGGTNAAGYFLIGDLGLADHLWTRVRYLASKQIDGPIYRNDIVQLDINARF